MKLSVITTAHGTGSTMYAKAKNAAEVSSGILVSFDAHWLDPILGKKFQKVLRKRVPVSAIPDWMYIYVNAPTSTLIARSLIKSVDEVTMAEALHDSKELCLTEAQVRYYFGDSKTVGRYTLNTIQIADHKLSLTELRGKMVFHPPQSFFFLSTKAKDTIDDWARFRK